MAANKASARLTLDDGTDLADKIDPRFLSLTLTEKRGDEADMLELTLHNHDGKIAAPKKGVFLSLALGWVSGDAVQTGLVDKGKFKVDEVEREGPPDIIVIRARAADVSGAHRKRRNKAWKNTTLGAIITEIASANGQTAAVHPDLASIAVAAIEQGAKSNKQFVRDLGQRYDAVATWKNKTLVFMPVGSETTASGKPLPSFTLRKIDGFKWRFTEADHNNHDGAEAQYHDQNEAKTKTVKVGGSNRKLLKKTYASEADAKAAAKAEAARSKRSVYSFNYDLALGNTSLIANAKVTLSGWDSQIDGIKWVVDEIRHQLDGRGLKSDLVMQGE